MRAKVAALFLKLTVATPFAFLLPTLIQGSSFLQIDSEDAFTGLDFEAISRHQKRLFRFKLRSQIISSVLLCLGHDLIGKTFIYFPQEKMEYFIGENGSIRFHEGETHSFFNWVLVDDSIAI